jgi:acyl carrier protein
VQGRVSVPLACFLQTGGVFAETFPKQLSNNEHIMPLDEANLKSQIKKFIAENMLFSGDGFTHADDASLLEAGIIDSIGVMELVTFVGNTFKITVPPEDIVPDNFDSVQKLADYIRRKQG